MHKLSPVLTNPPPSRAAHMSIQAGREAGGWLLVLALSASLASVMTLALASARHEPEPLGATMRIASGSLADYWSCARDVVREASMLNAPDTAGPYVPDGIPDGADAWAAGKIRLDPLDDTASGACWRAAADEQDALSGR
jgi:hypothetical protein